ncbi:NRDE family protein [Alkalilimnicola sp. S0819]|uniref:NRDE family protein n=1 Tax=Alkalilimnicola sp. S0819 TaxID=2613922 RepID=UPI001261D794|nr:NRDE family protein [Alkalilimnicola sp. S0819]KAB7628406.1 NRDE family protein [Alkalilimnicola sp. S0819]MPQ15309.1 hypothetical protein [Alkalilimnicola sp. S0819]
MCLLLFAHGLEPDLPLVIAANRDEFHARPTAPAHWWREPRILAGQDQQAGGSWMGSTRGGRIAVVTNYRDPPSHREGAGSRGELVTLALQGRFDGADGRRELAARGGEYNSFNLVYGEASALWYYSDREGEVRRLPPGLYGLSNHVLETPWPKVTRGKALLRAWLDGPRRGDPEGLFALLADTRQPEPAELPDTGLSAEWERLLATLFIRSPRYGTRASTVVMDDARGQRLFAERAFNEAGETRQTRWFRFATR